MEFERSCGVLLHITSLPGKYGIGTLGCEAFSFAEWLKESGQMYWQILPIGPVTGGFGYSPYASTSTFAGNYLLINLEMLEEEGLIDLGKSDIFTESHFVDFERLEIHKKYFLKRASQAFFSTATDERKEYEKFCSMNSGWLDDFSLFTAVSEHFNTTNWTEWEDPISRHEPKAIQVWNEKLHDSVTYHKFVQYVFFKQWNGFKKHCAGLGIKLIGDIPIYIAFEGVSAWAHPEILLLDKKTGLPTEVAGVPPDYFSETGQRWGNPLYRWFDGKGTLNGNTLDWWKRRIDHLRSLVDLIRIDHFRGFESYWAIPYSEKTAIKGKWTKGPGVEFFKRLESELGELPLIAEDLGVITPAVEKLRDDLGLPGMKVLQFAFDFNKLNYYLPHNYDNPNCVVYTGTHDNNTTNGWFYGTDIDEGTRSYILDYMGADTIADFHIKLIKLAYRSNAKLVMIPAQDILGYGAEFKMNKPGTAHGNWAWKLTKGGLTEEHSKMLKHLADMYDRIRD